MWDPYAQFETAILPNGLTVHVLHWPERAGVHFMFGIHSGSRQDEVGKEGAAHFMEHLVHCNGGSSFDELMRFFETNSGHMPQLGATSLSWTRYGFCSPIEPQILFQSLQFFGHMLLNARIEREMEAQRAIIVGEFKKKYPSVWKYELERRKLQGGFPGTIFERMSSPLGTPESIAGMTEVDLQRYYDTNYTPQNMVVVVVGEMPLDEIVGYLRASPFSTFKPGERTLTKPPIWDLPRPSHTHETFSLKEVAPGTTTAHYESIAQLPGVFTLAQVHVVRLMLMHELFGAIRQDRQWSYHTSTSWMPFGTDSYGFWIDVPGLNPDAVNQIEAVVSDCIHSLPERRGRLDTVKQSLIASKRYQDMNAQMIAKDALTYFMHFGRIGTLREEIEHIERVTAEDVAAITSFLSSERRFTLIQVP